MFARQRFFGITLLPLWQTRTDICLPSLRGTGPQDKLLIRLAPRLPAECGSRCSRPRPRHCLGVLLRNIQCRWAAKILSTPAHECVPNRHGSQLSSTGSPAFTRGCPAMHEKQSWPETAGVLRLARRSNRCTVLGPGVRAVLWVQGCPLRCPGCVASETLPSEGGEAVSVSSLAEELLALHEIDGLTFSGGEPMAQASALTELVDSVRARRDLSIACYTGFPLDHLRSKGTRAQQELISRLDILIDGPYLRERHTNLRWRGSENQQVHFLSPRYRHLAPMAHERGSWIEFELDEQETLHWMGIPPPGFRAAFEQQMDRIGVLTNRNGGSHE